MKFKNSLQEFALVILFFFIYFFTTLNQTKPHSFSLLFICLIFLLSSLLFKKKYNNVLIYLTIATILLIVGITGWFYSPLFSWIYILAIALSFLFNSTMSTLFILVLVGVFIPYLGSIDVNLDILTIASLLLIIPLNHFLRNEYLRLTESDKRILILKEENQKYENKLTEVLANKISKTAVDVKQPLNTARQIALYEKSKNPKNKNIEKITELTENALQLLKKFEEESTGIKLTKNPKK